MRSRWHSAVCVAFALSLAGNWTTLHASAVARACCKKAHFQCAGTRSPDDCCRSMRNGGRQDSATTRADAHADSPTLALPVEAPALDRSDASAGCVNEFKRPHDPPHLHRFNLLI